MADCSKGNGRNDENGTPVQVNRMNQAVLNMKKLNLEELHKIYKEHRIHFYQLRNRMRKHRHSVSLIS